MSPSGLEGRSWRLQGLSSYDEEEDEDVEGEEGKVDVENWEFGF